MASYSGVSGVLTPTFTTYSGVLLSGIAPSGFSPIYTFPVAGGGGGGSGVVYPTVGQLYPYY